MHIFYLLFLGPTIGGRYIRDSLSSCFWTQDNDQCSSSPSYECKHFVAIIHVMHFERRLISSINSKRKGWYMSSSNLISIDTLWRYVFYTVAPREQLIGRVIAIVAINLVFTTILTCEEQLRLPIVTHRCFIARYMFQFRYVKQTSRSFYIINSQRLPRPNTGLPLFPTDIDKKDKKYPAKPWKTT